MVARVAHTFVSALPDIPSQVAAGNVAPSHWNAEHVITGVELEGAAAAAVAAEVIARNAAISSAVATFASTLGSAAYASTAAFLAVGGTAVAANALATARNINGVAFNGTADITVTAAAGTLTGATLAANVTASSLLSAAGGTFGTAAFTAVGAYATLGANTFTGAQTIAPTANGQALIVNPAGVSGNGGVTWSATYAPYAWSNGPVGQVNYIDDVYQLGTNLAFGGRLDASKPALYLQWESKFYQGGRFGSEFHTEFITASGTSLRPDGSFYPHDGGAGSVRNISVDTLVFDRLVGAGGTSSLQLDALNKRLYVQNSASIDGTVNNVPMLRQLNAAGSTYVNGPYLNASNQWLFSGGLYSVGGGAGVPNVDVVASGLTAGNPIIRVQGTLASAGDIDVLTAVMGVNGGLRGIIQNNGNYTNASAELRLHALYGNSGADTKVVWESFGVNGTARAFAAGIDQSDSAKWKLSNANSLGSNDRLIVDATGNVIHPIAATFGATTAPTARVHIAAGTATANTAPLKFTSGVNLTTAEAGAFEYDGAQLYFTRAGTTRDTVVMNSAAVTTLGAADAASPVAQMLSVQSVVAGTSNTAGAAFTIGGSKGTGTGAGGSLIFQVAAAGSTGSTQNALATALTIDSTKLATLTGNLLGAGWIKLDGNLSKLDVTGGGQAVIRQNGNSDGYAITRGDSRGSALHFHAGKIQASADGRFEFNSVNDPYSGAPDLFVVRAAAATWQHGAANAASAIDQIVQAQGNRPGTDSNGVGGKLTLRPGAGTGTGVNAALVLQSYLTTAVSATTVQTATDSITVSLGGATVGVGGLTFPSADPHIVGRWWDSAGTLTKSAG